MTDRAYPYPDADALARLVRLTYRLDGVREAAEATTWETDDDPAEVAAWLAGLTAVAVRMADATPDGLAAAVAALDAHDPDPERTAADVAEDAAYLA